MDARAYAREKRERFLEDLKELIRIPSISTFPEHHRDLELAARWLETRLNGLGMKARVIPSDHHPIVYAEWLQAADRPTLLCYGHYDVQPPDPVELWQTPPFEPTVRGDNLFARGASDDKGQLLAQIFAVESWMRTAGRLPLNVKFIIEGEEEIGSPRVLKFVPRHKKLLAANASLVCDGQFFAPELPAIVTGLRGLLYTEVEAQGAKSDLHSGQFGGAAPNAINALAQIIAGLKDRKGRITVPRFYAPVKPPSEAERQAWERLPFKEEEYLQSLGVDKVPGEEGYGILERRWARPTLDAHGIVGGFTGAGAKTVLPSRASAKISMRLVPDQRASSVLKAYTRKVQALTPPGVKTEVKVHSMGDPVVVSPDEPAVRLGAQALKEVTGREPVFVREGGSVPIVTEFVRALGAPAVMMGFGLPDDNLHAPNEKFYLPNFYRGIEAVIRFMELLGERRL